MSVPSRRVTGLALGCILALALALRLWHIRHGLPFAYNADEAEHFVPKAVDLLRRGSLDPAYYENPPALTYLLYAVFKLRFTVGFPFGGERALARRFAADPQAAYVTARVVVVLLGTLVVGLTHWAGARFYDRRVGLVGAAVMAVAFLPVFYSKHALNDVVTLVPVTIALVGCLLVYERGRPGDWVLSGAAIGVATATKYTAGAMLVCLAVAAGLRVQRTHSSPSAARSTSDRAELRRVLGGLLLAGAACIAAFAVLNPFAIVHHSEARGQISGQSRQAAGGKLGQDQLSGWVYYLRTLTWGFGWLPLLGAVAGGALALRRDWRRGLLLVCFPLFLFGFLGHEARFFGRWLLPIYPALCVLCGFAVIRAADALRPRLALAIVPGAVIALCVQGLLTSVHVDRVLGREDTRAQARAWLDTHVPDGSRIALEPFVPAGYLTMPSGGRRQFERYYVPRPYQAYEKRLRPLRIERYRQGGYCWVVVGSHQKDRGLAAGLAGARAYYRALDAASAETVRFSPYRRGAKPVKFSYDKSFNYSPGAFERPGPVVEIHRLRDCTPRR